MDKSIIGFFLLLGIIAGGIFIYYYFEKPMQDEVLELVDFNIFAKNIDGELVKTGYKIYSDGNFYEDGKTSSKAGVNHKVPKNKSIIIYNYDLDNKNKYYFQEIEKFTELDDPYRISLKLERPGNLTLNYSEKFGVDRFFNITLNSDEANRNLKMCIKWSAHILYLKNYLEKLDEEERLIGYDKCYKLDDVTRYNSTNFLLEYDFFDEITEKDYIKIKFIGYNIEPITNEKLQNFEKELKISKN